MSVRSREEERKGEERTWTWGPADNQSPGPDVRAGGAGDSELIM